MRLRGLFRLFPMASSPSTNYSYDVFLSFRGTDTRNNFTGHLYKALCDNNVKAFIDNNIDRGEEITSFLEGIIEGVKLSIIVFSSDYASSTFCLDEMVKIIECKETKAQIVLPIFYKVYPSEDIYKEAFARYEQTSKQQTIAERLKSLFWRVLYWAASFVTFKRYGEIISQNMKVERWRSSFQKSLELAGWHIDDNRNEATVIEEITRDVLKRLNCQFEGEMKITPIVGQTSENYLEKIMQCLRNDENPKVGVWGMGGVGKTTIVTHINNRLLNDASFSRRIYWVTVSKDSSISKLQHDIAKVIKCNLSGEDNERKRAAKLSNELQRFNKFVLILDDVWEPFETEDVGIPLMDGQKLLLTTRDFGVCQRMMCQPIEVKPLFEHEAVDLFLKESKIQINSSREWREIVQSVVKECAGLPLAIVVVARRMRGVVEIWKWRNALRELQKPFEGENLEIEEKVFKVLKFSYDRLPNDRCRQCFLHCSLFPEDYEIEREDLIDYWIGEGLIEEPDSWQAELDKGNVILDELIHSSLLKTYETPWEQIAIKMHDVIRDMGRIIVKVGLQFQNSLESVQVLNETKLKSFPNSIRHCSELKTLVLRGHDINELSGCFFANMQSLNVLDMTNTIRLKSIPDSITNLGNLRLLIIRNYIYLKCIPSLVKLEKLRYLKISGNQNLKEIPKGIERLANLRVLDLSWNESLSGSFPSGVVEKLSHLQSLNLIGTRVDVEPEMLIALEKLEILRVLFCNLDKLNCYLKSGHWRGLVDYQINYGRFHYVILKKGICLDAIRDVEEWKRKSGIFLPDNIQDLQLVEWESPMFCVLKKPTFADLQSILISKHKSRYLFTVDLAQQLNLHNVEKLFIRESNELEEIIATEEEWANGSNYYTIVLPNLKRLFLFDLPELRSIYRGRMACPSLQLIQIDYCDKVERLPFCMEKDGYKQNPTIHLRGCYPDASRLARMQFSVSLQRDIPEFKIRMWYESLQWESLQRDIPISRRWWESLRWDDPNVKSMYHPLLSTESESKSEHESESKVDAKNESKSQNERESESEHEGESELEHERKSESEHESKSESEHEGESESEHERESESEHEGESKSEHETESESKHEGESEVNQENLGQTSNNTNAMSATSAISFWTNTSTAIQKPEHESESKVDAKNESESS